jgi:type I restriction enzyme S subunit
MKRKDSMTRWSSVALGDLITLEYGKSFPEHKRKPGPYAVYGSNGLVGRAHEYLIEERTIVVGRKGSAGEVNYAEPMSWPIDTAYYVQLEDKKLYSLDFAYYLLKWVDPRRLIDTTTKPGLNRDRLYAQIIPLPPLPVQERIVQILQKADEIRRKRREALELVEKVLPAIYYEFFGDPAFNPKGYKRARIGEVTTLVTSGYTPRGGARNYVADGPLLLRSQNVQMLHLSLEDCAHLPESIFEGMQRVHVQAGDVLLNITGKGTAGRIAWIDDLNLRAAVNQHVCIIRPNPDKISPQYLAFTLATPFYQHIIENAPGSAQSGFNHARVRALEVLVPPMQVQRAFVMQVQGLIEIRKKFIAAIEDIEHGFQGLQSRAFTGELTAEWEAANADWIATQQAFHERLPRLLVLALLMEKAKRAGRKPAEVLVTTLMKYAFLLQMEGNGGRRLLYHFVPYHYGPFAKELYGDLEGLQREGLVRVENDPEEDKTKITVVNEAKASEALAELPDDLREDTARIIETYNDLDHNALLKTVYEKYPAYARKSRLKRRRRSSR